MNDFNQKNQRVENQVNAENVEQEIENSGNLSQEINAQKVHIGNKPVSCPNCKTSNKITNRFCKECGKSLTKLCKTCWTENDLVSIYCVSCGTEVDSSKFSIPPQYAQLWKERFMSLGWHVSPISQGILEKLEKIGQPTNKNEIIILTVGVSGKSIIHKASVAGREILPNPSPVHEKMVMGSIIFTSQRIILKSDPGRWVASYPHEYLDNITSSEGIAFVYFKKQDAVTFSLDYKGLGKVAIHKLMPSLIQPRGIISRMTSSDLWNAQMDLQTTLINTAIGGKLQESYTENSVFTSFFEYIIELQKNHHKNMPDLTSGISSEQFIYSPPVAQLQQVVTPSPKANSKSSNASPDKSIVIILFIIAIGFFGFWYFLTLLFPNH